MASNKMNRRNFLKTATLGVAATTVGAVGLSGCSQPSASSAADNSTSSSSMELPVGLLASDFDESPVIVEPITEFADEMTYDVVVVGAGTGGVPAAMAALEEGASVALLEKSTTAVSQGGGGTGVVLEQSDEQGVQNFIQGFLEDCGWRADRSLAEFYARYSGEALRWWQYYATEAGHKPNRVTETNTDYEDGSHCVRRSVSIGPKPAHNGTLIVMLADLAESKGVDIYYSTPGVQLITDDSGAVVGVVGKNEADEYIKFNATKGVVLSTGDYQNNQSLVERYCPDVRDFDRKQFDKTGDGILMSMQLGAGFVQVGHAHMMHDFDSGPMFEEPFLYVNEDGERFMNEDCVFEEINNVLRNQPRPGWYSEIFDDNYVAQVTEWGGRPTAKEDMPKYMPDIEMDRSTEGGLGVREDLIDTYSCETLDELAEKLGIPADALKDSVARYNELCDAGFDADFGKGMKYMKKIEQSPFWGIHKHVRVSALCAGMTVNENYQVITKEGSVIPNLWASGFGAGQLCGAPDWSMYQSGMSVGHCVTSGRYCGIQAAADGSLTPSKPVTEEDIATLA